MRRTRRSEVAFSWFSWRPVLSVGPHVRILLLHYQTTLLIYFHANTVKFRCLTCLAIKFGVEVVAMFSKRPSDEQ